MTRQLKNLLMVAMMVVIGIGCYQIIKVYENQKETARQNEKLVQANKQMFFDLETLTAKNKQLEVDIQEREKDIQEIMDEYYAYRTRDMSNILELAKQAASLGWTARGHKGMTLDDLYLMLDRK